MPADVRTAARRARPPRQPSRAARQVAGLALPTRSVHALPDRAALAASVATEPLGRARAARSAFSFTTALALLTFAAAGLDVAREPAALRAAGAEGTADLLDDITTASATASVAACAIGLVAMVVWCVRAAGRALHQRVDRHRYA